MGGGPGEEVELEEAEGGPGDTERRRSPPIWLRTWLFGLCGLRGLICVIVCKEEVGISRRIRAITEHLRWETTITERVD